MQVAHHHDHITSVVIGSMDAIAASIDDSAEFMHMVTSTIYSDQPLAVVREVLCNAWDAHIDSKREHLPLIVMINDQEMVIQDFGHGIPHSKIGQIYGTYGGSTKKKDNNATGGFGLGSKAPWAYQDSFEVTSCHQGTKTLYVMSKSSGEVMGKPGINPIMQLPTDEMGLTVKVEMKPGDRKKFHALIMRIITNGEMNALVNGVQAPVMPFSKIENGYMLTFEEVLANKTLIAVRSGTVIYPLTSHPDFEAEFKKAGSFVEGISKRNLNGYSRYGNQDENYTLVLQAPPGSISPTPSRESLSMQAHTVKTVTKLLTDFIKVTRSPKSALSKFEYVKAQVERRLADKPLLLLERDIQLPYRQDLLTSLGRANIYTWNDVIRVGTINRYPEESRLDDVKFRLRKLMEAGIGDRGLIMSFLAEINWQNHKKNKTKLNYHRTWEARNPYAVWFRKQILAPLARDMQQKAGKFVSKTTDCMLKFDRLSLLDQAMSSNSNNDITATKSIRGREYNEILPYLRKVVVISSNVERREEVLRHRDKWIQYGPQQGMLHYRVAPSAKYQAAAVEFFTKRGYTVIDTNAVQEWETAPSPNAVKILKPKVISVPRLKGYVALKTLWPIGSNQLSVARAYQEDTAAMNRDAPRIDTPLCYHEISRSDARYGQRALYNSHEGVEELIRMFGDICALSYSDKQTQKFKDPKGMALPDLEDYATGVIINQVTQSSSFLEYWAFSPYRAVYRWDNSPARVTRVPNPDGFASFVQIPLVREVFELKGYLTKDEILVKNLWENFCKNRRCYKPHGSITTDEAKKLINEIPLKPAMYKALQVYMANPLLRLFNVDAMQEILNNNTGSLSERHRGWLLDQMINTALKG